MGAAVYAKQLLHTPQNKSWTEKKWQENTVCEVKTDTFGCTVE
jgi:hypothetical protein